MKLVLNMIFFSFTIGLLTVSCKKDKGVVSTAPTTPTSTPTNTNTTSATIYSVTGVIRSYKCFNVTAGKVILVSNYVLYTPYPSTTLQPNGSFTFTYSAASTYSNITLAYVETNYKGQQLHLYTKTVPAYQNCDIGTYDMFPTAWFYVRFRSISNSTITNVSLTDETHYTGQPNYPIHTPVLTGPFTDTTLVFLHSIHGGNVAQAGSEYYNPYSEANVTELPISFKCKHNNIDYSAQKNMLKCNGSPSDTLYIDLP